MDSENRTKHSVKSWLDLMQLVEDIDKNGTGRIWYRGQASSNWALSPSISRIFTSSRPGTALSKDRAFQLEQRITHEFGCRLPQHSPQFDINGIRPSTFDLWVLMQHHGCPTRLLDWTESFFIALYFAVNEEPEQDGAVWYFEHFGASMERSYEKLSLDDWRDSLQREPILYYARPLRHIRRSHFQHGVFTLSSDPTIDHDAPGILCTNRINVPADLKLNIRRKLRMMNLTPEWLFPGLDGLGQFCAEILAESIYEAYVEAENSSTK